MKKSLFSLLILSTLSLSTQAIAQQINLGGQDITIQGRVIQDALTCNVQPVGVIQLDDAHIDSLAGAPITKFSIDFTDCTNPQVDKKVKVVIKPQAYSHLINSSLEPGNTNARVALLNKEDEPISLNGNLDERTFSSDVRNENGSLAFSLKYAAPESGDPVTAGAFNATLSFDAYVTDDIQ
ncbi:fimbrial protein [Proteus mirabilis]|uniref:fimbrial protein n=1 Tax=Proteus mirabilis TaxID=584 RepID=UPI0034D5F7F6